MHGDGKERKKKRYEIFRLGEFTGGKESAEGNIKTLVCMRVCIYTCVRACWW